VQPGDWSRLGPTLTSSGVNFAVFAPRASRIELCLFGDVQDSRGETARLTLPTRTHGVHAGFVPGLMAGARYGLRAHGVWDPTAGSRFNPNKLLLDPYAPQISGEISWVDGLSGHVLGQPECMDLSDSALYVPKGVVADPSFEWRGDIAPRVPWSESVIYEAHVKGLTATHAGVPAHLRGTYLGVAHPTMLAHFAGLGITAVQLLPVQARISEARLHALGLTNYWGYGTLGFFAPDPRFATAPGREIAEFKEMVATLHAAGIEVLLDVVYNHTIEGGADGPQLSLRGLANRAYYRLEEGAPSRHVDWTGCGNTLNLSSPPALRLVLDSLRAWVRDYHVDGFRFDLAPALFRDAEGRFDSKGGFAAALHQDPMLAGVKLIAEPWDLGPDGYRLGEHPRPFAEWNDQFRDTARRFWRGDGGQLPDLARRLGGSSDRFGDPGEQQVPRGPLASINYVACHDGFTLADLVAYAGKHNEANGEQGRDGTDHNWSTNWGVEGPTLDPAIREVRARVARSLLGTTLLALGVPMLGAGDELGRTQGGNNNAYCQDSLVSWLDWDTADGELLGFVSHLLSLRRNTPALRRGSFLSDADAQWLHPDGRDLREIDWNDPEARCFGLLLRAGGVPHSEPLVALLFNGGGADRVFLLPDELADSCVIVLNSAAPRVRCGAHCGPALTVPAHSLIVLEPASRSTRDRPAG